MEWLSWNKQIRFAKWMKETVKSESVFGNKKTETEIDVFVQQNMDITGWTGEYFNINLKKLEEEKQAMLKEIRKLQEKNP